MVNKTNDSTRQEQLEQWAEMVRTCESRPKEMSVNEWCKQYGITRELYYYRRKEVAKAGLLPKKRKIKPKRKAKNSSIAEAVVEKPVVETEVVDEKTTDSAVKETASVEVAVEEVIAPVEVITESKPEVEESPVVDETEEEPVIEESKTVEDPAVEESIPAKGEEKPSTATIDITIGPAVIHVNNKTSHELLSKVVQSLVSAMQTK